MQRTQIPRVDAEPVAPGTRPLARQLAQWRVFLPFYARAIGLQGSHPTVARALLDYSSVLMDPWGRAARTTAYALRLVYGEDRTSVASELRELHRPFSGVGYDGRAYRAWDREVWTWVHLTTAESLVYAVDVMCGPWPRRDLEAFYRDTRRIGVLYGVRESDMPADLRGLRAYVDGGVVTVLRPNPGTEQLRRAVLRGDHLRALPLPGVLNAAFRHVLAGPSRTLLFGAFPEPVRRLWRVRWTVLDQARYVALLLALRAATEPLPDRLRMFPPAYCVLHERRTASRGRTAAGTLTRSGSGGMLWGSRRR